MVWQGKGEPALQSVTELAGSATRRKCEVQRPLTPGVIGAVKDKAEAEGESMQFIQGLWGPVYMLLLLLGYL